MRIQLGQFTQDASRFEDEGDLTPIDFIASIEPSLIRFNRSTGETYDHCAKLCIQTVNLSPGDKQHFNIELESLSEDRQTLSDTVGARTCNKIWKEFQRYTRRPFYHIHNHSSIAPLYFEPLSARQRQEDVQFSVYKEREPYEYGDGDSSTFITLEFKSREDLEHFLIANRIANKTSYEIPTQKQFDTALLSGKRDAFIVEQKQLELEKLMSEKELNRYQATRPSIDSFSEPTPEYFRWYEYGGKPRPEPLTKEALDALLKNPEDECLPHYYAPTQAEWESIKKDRLGPLRPAVELLQNIVQQYESDEPWLKSARKAADWCHRDHDMLYDTTYALEELLLRAQLDKELNNKPLPAWHQQVTDALSTIKTVFESNDDICHWLPRTLIPLHASRDHFLEYRQQYLDEMQRGDTEQAAYSHESLLALEIKNPLFTGLIQFDDKLNNDNSPAP